MKKMSEVNVNSVNNPHPQARITNVIKAILGLSMQRCSTMNSGQLFSYCNSLLLCSLFLVFILLKIAFNFC